MCGIIGYIGDKKALPFLLSGLKNLEYRGYDSCGIALLGDKRLQVVKTKGEVERLITKTHNLDSKATLGIGHTRWATHGKPSQKNAHPHLDCRGSIAVVHNGIIENYQELKKELVKKGHKFTSDTDTEILPHLIEDNLKKKKDLLWATRQALLQVVGAYGVVVICSDFPNQIIAARLSSPLILGFGKDENFIASDQPALLPWTKNIATLKDGQIARIIKNEVETRNLDGQSANYQRILIEEEMEQIDKAGFAHFMLKEIYEQPRVIQDGLRGRFSPKLGVKLGGIEECLDRFVELDYLTIIACGTSYHAALVGKIYFQKLAELPVLVEDATELVGVDYPWQKGQPVIFVSQSGETADVLTVMRQAKKGQILPFGLVNVVGSSVARETKAGVYLRAGYEIGVAATKTFTAQILAFLLWAILVGEKRGQLRSKKSFYQEILRLPEFVSKILDQKNKIKNLAKKLKNTEKIYILGRGLGYAASLEGALKIKEISYLPSEAIGAGELKHGPLALVDKDTVLIFLLPDDSQFKKNLNSLSETVARGGQIFVLTNRSDYSWPERIEKIFHFDDCHHLLSVFPMTVWLQLLSYFLADSLDRPVDKPRHLAKSVTVE